MVTHMNARTHCGGPEDMSVSDKESSTVLFGLFERDSRLQSCDETCGPYRTRRQGSDIHTAGRRLLDHHPRNIDLRGPAYLHRSEDCADRVVQAQQKPRHLCQSDGERLPFADLIKKETVKWADVVKRSGAKVD